MLPCNNSIIPRKWIDPGYPSKLWGKRMDGWMDGWMDPYNVDGWMDGWMYVDSLNVVSLHNKSIGKVDLLFNACSLPSS